MSTCIPRTLSILFAAAALAACGGGGNEVSGTGMVRTQSGGAAPTIHTVAGGNIVGRTDPSFILVMGHGSTFLFYGPDLAAQPLVTGYLYDHGGTASYPGDPTVYNATDGAWQGFGYGAVLSVAIDPSGAVTGSLRYRDQPTTYTLAGGPVPGSSYRYGQPANIGDAAGTWELADMQGNAMTLSVSTEGRISGSYLGCTLAGSFKPAAGGKNVMDLQMVLSGSACSTVQETYNGFAIAFPMTGGGMQLLTWVEAYGAWDTYAIFGIGRR